jgi:GTP-binding protein YchF
MDPAILQVLKSADALMVVVDAFSPSSDPEADFASVVEEFALNDLIVATTRLERLERELRSRKEDRLVHEKELIERCRELLENGSRLVGMPLTDAEEKSIRGFQFLTRKPLLIVINMSEDDLSMGNAPALERKFANIENARAAAVCAKIEMEIASLDDPAERQEFLSSMGIDEPALGKLIRLSYQELGLMSFLTAGPDEVRAWPVRKGATAPECAGVIHSDLERGFIRAETIAYDDLMRAGSMKAAKDMGLLRLEGKEYVVKDGDILNIRFSV